MVSARMCGLLERHGYEYESEGVAGDTVQKTGFASAVLSPI